MKKLKFIFICVFSFSLLMCTGSNIYKEKKTYLTMAGSGDPWSALTKKRRNILRALHDGLTLESLAEVFNMSVEQIISEIKPMQEASLVKEENNHYTPSFFISDLSETKKVYEHSKATGKILAEALFSQWDKLEQSYSELSFSKSYSLKEQGFMLVGSRILDIGVLGALVRDKTLMTQAPSRPSPNRPDARYYFWMVEGELEHLGKYGQDDTDLSWNNWHFLNFGQSFINGKLNQHRRSFERKCAKIIKSNRSENPELLAKELNVPFLNKVDSMIWAEVTKQISNNLLKILKEHSADFKQFYDTLQASKYANNSFGEFFCWYYHLAYAWAIDTLQEKGVITIPQEGYIGIVLYREGLEGVVL